MPFHQPTVLTRESLRAGTFAAALAIGLALVAGCGKKSATAPTAAPTPAPTGPDLVVSAVSLSTTAGSIGKQDPVTYCYTIANVGAAVPGPNSVFDTSVFFSRDVTFDNGDLEWNAAYSSSVYPLTSGFSIQLCPTITLSGTLPPPGAYYLIVLVDAKPNAPPNFFPGVAEIDESNNWRASTGQITLMP